MNSLIYWVPILCQNLFKALIKTEESGTSWGQGDESLKSAYLFVFPTSSPAILNPGDIFIALRGSMSQKTTAPYHLWNVASQYTKKEELGGGSSCSFHWLWRGAVSLFSLEGKVLELANGFRECSEWSYCVETLPPFYLPLPMICASPLWFVACVPSPP